MDKTKPIAVYFLGLEGVEILDIKYGIEDTLVARYMGEIYESVVEYDGNEPFFRIEELKIPLNECMRI